MVALALGAAPAGAHTEVLRARPAPAEEVTGVVDHVELTYLDPVLPDVRISVVDESGEPVPDLGQAELSADGRTARVDFAPLVGAGAYVVDHTFTARDGDRQRETYRFTYRPAAPTDASGPTTTPSRVSESDDPSWPVRIAVAGALAVAAVAAFGVRRARRTGERS